jgi:hypothetical protein
MLRQRPAGDKSWPIACSDTTLGTTAKDLSGALPNISRASAIVAHPFGVQLLVVTENARAELRLSCEYLNYTPLSLLF